MATRNLLVDWLNNKKNAVSDVIGNIQNVVNKASATNVSKIKTPNSPTLPQIDTSKILRKAVPAQTTTPVQTNATTNVITGPYAQMKQQEANINPLSLAMAQFRQQQGLDAANSQSRFIGFQNNQVAPKTDLAGNIIQENIPQKETLNISSRKAYQDAVYELQRDMLKNGGPLSEDDIKTYYKEFSKNVDAAMELQETIRPIVQQGYYADINDVENIFDDLLPAKKREKQNAKIVNLEERGEKLSQNYNLLSDKGQEYVDTWAEVKGFVDYVRENYELPGDPTDIDIINFGAKQVPEIEDAIKSLSKIKLSNMDKAVINRNSDTWYQNDIAAIQEGISNANSWYQNNVQNRFNDKIETGERAKRLNNGINVGGMQIGLNADAANKVSKIAQIPSNRVSGLLQGTDKIVTGGGRVILGQDRSLKEVADDIIKSGGGFLGILFNATPHGAIASSVIEGADILTEEGKQPGLVTQFFQRAGGSLDELQSGKDSDGNTNYDNRFTQWYNGLDEETRSDFLNEEMVAIMELLRIGGKEVKLRTDVAIDATKDAWRRTKAEIEGSEILQDAKNQRVYDPVTGTWKSGKSNLRQEFINRFKANLKENFSHYGDELSIRKGNNPLKGENELTDNRTTWEKAKSGAKDLYDEAKGEVTEGTEGVKNRVQDIKNKVTGKKNKATTPEVTEKTGGQGTQTDTEMNTTSPKEEINTSTDNQKGVEVKKGGIMSEKVYDKLTGLDEATRERMKANPYSAEENKNLIDTMEDDSAFDFNEYQTNRYQNVLDTIVDKLEQKENTRKNEVGPLYQKLEETNAPIDTTNIKRQSTTFRDKVAENDGIISSSEQTKINKLLDAIDSLGDGTTDIWKIRRMADQWAKWDTESTTDGIRLIREIRDAIDDEIRVQRPEMKEVDTEYRRIKDEIADLRGNLINKKSGKLRDNAVSTVKNLLNPSNKQFLDRLEKEIPGITKQLQAIRDSKFVYNAYQTGNGSRFISGITKGVFGNMGKLVGLSTGGLPGLLFGALLDKAVDTALTNLTRKALRETVTNMTPKAQAELQRIMNKVQEGKDLTAKEKAKLKDIENKIVENADKAKKTKAEQEAWDNFLDRVKKDAKSLKLPDKGGTDGGKNILTNGKTIITDAQGNSKVKGQISEIDKRPSKPEDTTPPSKPTTPTKPTEPKNKITDKTPKKKSESKPKAESKPQRITAPKKERQIIKNNKGENEIVYHGTNAKFDKFDKNFIGRGGGFRFTTSKGEAETYGKNVKEYNLMASNILDADADNWTDLADSLIKQYTREKFGKEFYISPEAFIQDEGLRNYVQELGYDALKFSKGGDTKYIVYNEDQIIPVQKQPKAKATKTAKNKITNPSKVKETSLFNEKEVDKGNKSEGLNPDALPLSDYREMQRLNDGEYHSLSSALRKESLKDYMAKKIATELVGDYDEIVADEFDPENLEDEWVDRYNEVEEMYDAYEEYQDMKNSSDPFDENTLKNTLATADDYANDLVKGKTAKELIEQYKPEYESDLKVYNRLIKKYPSVFANGKIDLTGLEGRSLREFAGQENETAQDIDYQELAEAENETPQDIRDMEEQIEYIDNLLQNETLQITEAEAPQNKATTTAKNKITNVKVTKGGDIRPDNRGITGKFRNLTLKDYKTMQEVEGLEDEYLEGDAELIRNMEQLRDTMYYFDPTDWDLPEDFEIDYNNGYVKDRAKFVAENQQLLDRIEKGKTTKEDIDENEDYYDEEKKTRDTDGIIKWQKDLISEMFENSVDEAYPSNEFLDKFYDRYLDFLGDRELREANEKLNNFGVMFNKYNRWWNQGKDYSPSQREYRAKQDFERAMNENETPQIAEEEIKNKVTAKTPDNKPKDLVTNPNSVETLPSDVSPRKEAAKSGPKRIAPDRISWQQLTYAEGAKKIMEDIKKIARHIELQREMKKPMASRTDTRPLSEINSEIVQTGREIGNILGKNWLYKSTRTKEFKDLWKAIANANNDPSTLAGIGKEFYEKKVKQDLSKGYIYPEEVIEKIPGAKKAADSRARYQKGLDTSFSSKDERIDYSAKDKIGGGMKRQDGKPLTEEQKNEIVKGVMDFQKTFGINMKKMAEDMGIVYVHVNGKKVFMSKASGMFRRTYNDDGTVKNASVSVGGVETVRWKDKDTGEWMTESANTIMSHELGHVVDYVVDRNFIVGGDLVDIKYSYKRPQNNHSGYADYLRRDTEVVARAFEQYMAVQKGAGESYFDKPGYWSEKAFNERVKPILEKNIKEKLGDWYIDPESIKYQKVTQNAKNKITAKEKSESPISLREQKEVTDRLKKTGLAKDVIYVDATKDLFNLINGTTTQPRYQSVWHGSPYSFDKFDSANMGKGEGAQAHGWGHYVAVNKGTGEHYADMGYTKGLYKGMDKADVYSRYGRLARKSAEYTDEMGELNVSTAIIEDLINGKSFEESKRALKEKMQRYAEESPSNKLWEVSLRAIDKMKESDFNLEKGKNLYEVEIPDMKKADTPTGSNYIEEGKKLTEKQWNKFREAVEKVDDSKKYKMSDGTPVNIDGYYPGQSDTYRLYRQLSQVLGGDKEASLFLNSLGYDGIHYIGGRDGEAYVIFSDDALDITNHIQYLKDTNGDIAGATLPDGTVVLVKNNLRADTPYHEFSHLLRSYAKENSPALYNAINKIAEEAPQALKDYVKQTYGDLSEDAYLDEVFAWRQGKHSAVKGAEAWYQRMWDAIKELWNKIRNKFGKKYADLSVFDAWEKMSSEELMDKVDNILKGEKEIGKGKGNQNYEISKNAVDSKGKKLTPEQQMYFANSKVRDSDGNLLRVYHGTNAGDFTVYEKGKGDISNSLAKVGYRFSPSEQGAKNFAESSHRGDKVRVEEVYLDIQNPKIYEPRDINLLDEDAREKKINEQRNIYKEKNDKANGKDYTLAGGIFRDEFDHSYHERAIFENLKRRYENEKIYEGKFGKYDPEEFRKLAEEYNRQGADIDYDKILKDFEEYERLKEEAEVEHAKYQDMAWNDPYEDFQYDIYKVDRNMDNRWTKKDIGMALNDYNSPNKYVEKLKAQGYDGIIIKGTNYDGNVFGGKNDQYVAFDSNQIKRITNDNPTENPDVRYEKAGNIHSKNFKERFGDWENDPKNASKIVDDNGMPQKMYHGTPTAGITTFDKNKIGQNTGNYGYSGDGFYFTESKDYAGSYGDNVMEVYLDVKKPFHFSKENIKKYAKFFDGVEQGHVALDKEWVLNELKRNDKASYEFAKMWLENSQKARDNMTYPYNTKYDPNTIVDLLHETERDKTWLPTEFESRYLDEFEGFGEPKYVDDLYKHPSNPEYMLGLGEYSNQDFINAIRKDGYDGIQTLGETVVFEPSQIKSATDNVGTYDKNNPDIRYQKKNVLANGKNKVTNGIRFQLAEGSVDNIDAHRYEQNILRNKSDLQRYSDESNIDYTKRNGGYTIDDSLNELLEINSKKRGATKEREIKQAKREQIKEIINTIDEGHGGGWHYQRFFDNRYQWMPTIIFWKGDNLIDEVLAGREISFHQLKNKRGFEHVPTGRLPISPVRLRQAGLLQRLQN